MRSIFIGFSCSEYWISVDMCARWRPIRDQSGTPSPRSNRRNLAHQRNPHGFTNEISKYVKKKSRNSGAQEGTVGFIRIPGFRHPDLVTWREGGIGRGGGLRIRASQSGLWAVTPWSLDEWPKIGTHSWTTSTSSDWTRWWKRQDGPQSFESHPKKRQLCLGNIGNQLATNNQVSLARLRTTTFLGFTHEYLFRGESLFHICHYEKFLIASYGVNSVDMKWLEEGRLYMSDVEEGNIH